MSRRGYAPLPTNAQDLPGSGTSDELDAAFDDSNDEAAELLVTPNGVTVPPPNSAASIPGAYDFERERGYDYPPPGSPPGPSTTAIQGNTIGNSNGLVPEFDLNGSVGPQRSWFSRVAGSVLPTHYVQRLGYGRIPSGTVGGGAMNDGVFANIAAKPTRPVTARDDDNNVYVVPENSQALPPPSYAAASLDTVPPYYETTVHAPFTSNNVPGEVIIDNLATGTLFSFLWNMLISVSFQFIGFILTFVLHTTHAAKLGSRAGFGITLIQYGLNIRSRLDNHDGGETNADDWPGWQSGGASNPRPSERSDFQNSTIPAYTATPEIEKAMQVTSTEWLSFALMTIGWFILLTSLLGFWRVKRWERGILAPQSSQSATPVADAAVPSRPFRRPFGFPFQLQTRDVSRGFGFPSEPLTPDVAAIVALEHPDNTEEQNAGLRAIREARLARLAANEARLREDLTAAGLL